MKSMRRGSASSGLCGRRRPPRQEAELDHEIISSVSRLYFSIFRIDLKKNFYEEISSDNSVHRLTGHRGMAQQKLNELCSTFVDPEYRLGGPAVL